MSIWPIECSLKDPVKPDVRLFHKTYYVEARLEGIAKEKAKSLYHEYLKELIETEAKHPLTIEKAMEDRST